MAQQNQEQTAGQPTVIGGNCRLVGELFLEGSAIVHGQIEGQIEVTETLEVGEGGVVNGTIRAGALAVHGRVEGDVYCADALHLGPTANLSGDVYAAAFSADEGASCRGQVVIGQQAIAAAQASRGQSRSSGHSEVDDDGIAGRVDPVADSAPVSTSPNAARTLLRRRPSILTGASRGSAG